MCSVRHVRPDALSEERTGLFVDQTNSQCAVETGDCSSRK